MGSVLRSEQSTVMCFHLHIGPFQDHFLFDKPTGALLLCSGMARDWPDGRGIWLVGIEHDDRLFVGDIFECISLKEKFCIFSQICLKFESHVHHYPSLVQGIV